MTSNRRVAVVGAGVAGLTAIKSCLDEGLEPVCFELRSDIGGLWNYSDHCYPDDGARPYECLITNTSKWTTPFSDFPFPEDCPPLFSYGVFFSYLRNYANHFDVTKHIQFDTKVLSVSMATDYDVTGRWIVETENHESVRSDVFDYVMVCSGFCKTARMPKINGVEKFGGSSEHSQTYRSNLKYKNKSVLIIGNGNSAGDIAADISHVAKQLGQNCCLWPFKRFTFLPLANGRLRCYKMIFPLEHSHDTLALIGSILKTVGPAPPVYELQARFASRVFAGKHQLPARSKMADEVDECNDMIIRKFGRYNYKFQNLEYRDQLAEELGIKPTFADFLRNPKMAWTYYVDPAFPVHHRLVGAGALTNAMSICDLARKDTFAKQLRKLKSNNVSGSHIVVILFVLTLIVAVLFLRWI
ncbi:dimethylaniline monooxygenase [N-oxide-forming] 2-like [Gigantopelta aegis]|uniref:dimethylaniline monooxygenase [N-oxide-forming] 2-like n=1 Tax=Gigantopelta aegis TaxID=1735272 RepID=UPI001B888DFF|nr:dimethylaniline monooxygenase [N-oxide-forming] 2-like [Gigantopelta aegis]